MFTPRTDLAVEAHEIAAKHKSHIVDGVIFNEESLRGYKLTRIEIINESGEAATGKQIGKYLSLDVGHIWNRSEETESVTHAVADMLRETVGDADSIFIAGLGNTSITADALGPAALQHVITTRHLKSEASNIYEKMSFSDISSLAPGVLSQTGIESTEIIRSIASSIKPSVIIAIDALASRELSRLGTVIQISNAGIAPGSGVGNQRPALNANSLGVPVVSLGVPTVVDAVTLASSILELCGGSFNDIKAAGEYKNMFVTPKECDKIISFTSRIIGYAINIAFHKELSFDDMISILS